MTLQRRMDMSHVQFAPAVSDDIRKESGWGRETCRETLEECLATKTVVVSL
jgi:hypothetical protein